MTNDIKALQFRQNQLLKALRDISENTDDPGARECADEALAEPEEIVEAPATGGTAPLIQVAVRDTRGDKHLFRLQHAEIQTHECAMAITRQEFPHAKVVLAVVPRVEEDQVA